VETFQALASNDHIYSVINIVLVIQQVAVEGRIIHKTRVTILLPTFGKNGLTTELVKI